MNVQVIIPVYNPDEKFEQCLKMLNEQSIKNMDILIIDSGENKEYLHFCEKISNCTVFCIKKSEFNHGGTRQLGIEMRPESDFYVFLTQDAIPANKQSLEKLIDAFKNEKVGCAFGRQLPYKNADECAKFARLFNYGPVSYCRSIVDKNKYGIKTIFISNSFAAYRASALKCVGGFPGNINFGEDMYVSGKLLLHKYCITYEADAEVFHSHSFSLKNTFDRYMEIGKFHKQEKWIIRNFGLVKGEGAKYVLCGIKYMSKKTLHDLILFILEVFVKYFGYKYGALRSGDK